MGSGKSSLILFGSRFLNITGMIAPIPSCMEPRRLPAGLILLALSLISGESLRAQTTNFSVSTAAQLSSALAQTFSNNLLDSSLTHTITLTANISATSQMFINANVTIVGNGYGIDMNNADRAFFIAGGSVVISNLLIQNGNASGGTGVNGGGGGAGLGGALFVGSGSYLGGSGAVAFTGVSAPNVVLNNVSFLKNQASGGNSIVTISNPGGGGGGGMGGNGGGGLFDQPNFYGAGGGGGFGVGARGGGWSNSTALSYYPAGAGAFLGGASGGTGESGNPGGANGGGGGGSAGLFINGAAGGGGLAGSSVTNSTPYQVNTGGFGGGGGGEMFNIHGGGNGGFGGGGGSTGEGEDASSHGNGGIGGFGGGGGAGDDSEPGGQPGWGGFGAGVGKLFGNNGPIITSWQGGGGLGAGGAVFVMAGANLTINAGSFASNSVMGGTGFVDGSAYGAALFLGADVTFNISNNLTLESLGGAGNTSDPNVKQYNPLTPQNNAALDPNAQGGIIKTGAATLTMTGSNYYTGATVIHQGTVALGSGAIEQGTSEVIVGQNGGDNATLVLGSSSILDVFSGTNSAVMLGQNAGSTGTVVIGSGVGSSGAYIGANIIQGGVGGGSVVFEQEFAAGSNAPSIYPFYLQLTGNLQVIQNGPGTTLLSPDPNGNGNTFTGGLVINNGTVILNAPPLEEYGWALPIGSSVTINTNGALNLGGAVQGNAPSAGSVVLNGGSVYGGYFDVGTLQATSGNIAAYLVTDVFVQNGTGTVTITNSGYLHAGNLFDFMNPTNVAFINSGTLIVGGGSGLNFAGADMIVGSHSGSATLVLEGSSSIGAYYRTNPAVMLGEDIGSRGTLIAYPGVSYGGNFSIAPIIQGGYGGGQVVFQGGTNAIVNSFNIALTGNLQVVQDGPGTTLLEANTAYGPNTFTGGVVVNQGTLKSGGSRAIPAGNDITLNGGIFDLNGNSSTVELLILAGGILTNSSGSQVITPNNTVAVSGTIAASIAGTGGLTQQGNGTTTITVANGFTGGTFVNGGTLVAAASGALAGGPVTVSGGVLNLTNVNQSVSSFTLGSGTVSGTGTLSAGSFSVTNGLISASLGGAGTLTKAGTGSVTLSAFNSYTGGTVISAGELAVGNAGALGTGSVTLSSGTVLASIAGSAITLPNAITVSSGTGMIVNRGASALTLSGLLSKANTILVLAEGPFNLTGQITGGNAGTFNSDLVVSNATVTVSATNNNYVGPTYVIAGATLINGVANALPSNTVLNLGAASDTSDQTNTYNLAGYSQTIAALSSATNFSSVNRVTNTGGSATLTLGGSSKTTYAGTIGGNITLEGTGGGSIKLTRSNSYTGGTIIGSGKFAAMADGALGSGTVTLAGGTLELKTLLNIQALNWSAGEIQLPSLSTNTYSGSLNIARDLSLTNTGGLFDLTGGLLTEEVPIAMMSATNLTTNNFATTDFTVTGINGYSLSISNNTLWIKVGGGNLYVGTNSIPVTTNFTSSTSFFSNGYVGYTAASSNNQLHVSEAGTRLELAGYLDVGYNGSGNLMTISNGGVVSNTYGRIGAASSGNSVLVTGNNSHWINGTNITIGYYGSSNSLVISNQGKVTAVDGIIGRDHDATGNSVTVTGNNSHWTNSGSVHVGYRGSSNSLLISGGRVSDSNGYTGWDAAAFGNRAVVESNGVWINTADLSVGYRGSSNSLLIGSGTVSSSNGYVGQLSNAMGNSALVTGSNSLWTNAGNLFVGYEGSWNSLVISNGGRVFNAMGYIGSWSNAVGNLVTVTGSDSSWINSGDLYVGYAGQSNRLVISEGGFVSNVNGFDDGVDPTDAYNSVLVTGVGSRWVNSGNLTFGLAGHDNSLVISNRGTVSVGSNSIFGDRATASNNSVLVTGVGSLLTNSGNLYVGHEGSGNSLVISNEGRVAVVSNSYIGFTTNSSNNSVLVTGSNSLWSNGGTLTIGERGSGTLTIANSGSVAASSITIAASSNSLGTLNIGSYGGSDSAGTIGETTITFGSGSGSINFNQTNLFTLTSSLSGYGMVNQLGSGTTMLAGTNGAFTGNFNVVEGSLGFISSDSFGSGTLTLDNGGSMIYSGPNNAINNGSITVTNGTGVVLNTGGGTLTLAGRLTKANTTLVLAGGSFNVTGQITGGNAGTFNSDLVVSNATVTVSATNNNYVGPTYVIAGATLINGVANALPSNTVLNLGAASDTSAQTNTYNLAGFSQTIAALSSATNFSSTDRVTNTGGSATLTLGGSDRTTYAGTITGNIALNRSGAGTTTLTRSNNYSGGTLIESGRIITQNTHALGSGTVTLTGGALSLATNLTLSSLVWNSAAEISLPAVTSSNYLTVTGSAALTGSGTNRFNLSGVTLTTNPVQLFNFGTKSFTTNQFALTGVRYYELSIINNSLWAYNPALICPTGIPVMVSNSMTYQFVIFDPYSTLNITPTGNLTITSAMTVSNNSMVILNGVLTTPSLTVDQGSTLMGTGSLSLTGGNLTINGTFAPGNSPGTFFVSGGNLVMGASSVWDQQIYSASVYDRVVVTGNAILNGTMNITTDGVTQLQFGQKYNFLTASGGISGAFSSIVAPEGFRGRLLLSGDNTQANILIAPASYTQLAANRNQSNVATALNSFIPYTSGDQMVVSTSLDSLTASQYNQAFNAIMPNFYQQIATIAFNNANAQNMQLVQRLWGLRVAEGGGFSMSGLADNMPLLEGQGDGKGVQDSKKDILRPGLDNHWGMFVDGNGIFAQANSGNMLPGYNSQSGGVTTGLTYKWNENVGTGIYCGYQGTYTKSGADGSGLGTGSSLIDNAVRFGVFGTYGQKDGKGLFVNALAGGGYHNFQATRVIQYTGMNRTANSAPGAGELDTMLAAGYDIRKDKFTFGPTASLQYTYLGVNSLNETGAQSLSFNSGGWNSSSMLSSVGAHAAYSWVASKNILVVPQVNLSWQHEFMQNPYAISGNLGGTSPTFSNWSATPIRDFLYTGVGFTVEFSKRWNTSFFYNAAAGNQNLTSQNIFWSAGVKF